MNCSDMSILNHTHQNVIEATLASLNSDKRPKNHFVPSIHSLDPANFRSPANKETVLIYDHPTQKSLSQLLIFMNLHQHAKTHRFIDSV